MKPIAFDPLNDLAPVPFEQRHLNLAKAMKDHGLTWQPHVGCFVWDAQGIIDAVSPFPLHIYYILSLPRFIQIFGSAAEVAAGLVWLPTWHQARLLAVKLKIDHKEIASIWRTGEPIEPGDELISLYRLIMAAL
jgi:hypothetical protein